MYLSGGPVGALQYQGPQEEMIPSTPLPRIGETWTSTLAKVDGIAAKVSGTIVTFVSVSGNRAAIQLERLGAAARTPPDWVLKSSAPMWFQSCSRERCTGAAFIRYSRPGADAFEVVCPPHIPKGVQFEILERPFLATGFFHGSTCHACKHEGIEVFGELSWSRQRHDSLWSCSACAEWWMLTSWEGFSEDFTNQRAALRCPAGFIFKSIIGKEDVPLMPGLTYRVQVRIQMGHVLQGVKPPTIYDHVKEQEFG